MSAMRYAFFSENFKRFLLSTPKKIPINPITKRRESVTNLRACVSYDTAVELARDTDYCLSVVLSDQDDIVCIDLDTKLCENEELVALHKKIVDGCETYCEVSKSGNGYHIFGRGKVRKGINNRKKHIEVYGEKRHIVLTQNSYNNVFELNNIQDIIDWIEQDCESAFSVPDNDEIVGYFEPPMGSDVVIKKLLARKDSQRFKSLYYDGDLTNYNGDASRADMSLMELFCYYSKNDDECKELFLSSALGQREKAKRADYISLMINKIRLRHEELAEMKAAKGEADDEESPVEIDLTFGKESEATKAKPVALSLKEKMAKKKEAKQQRVKQIKESSDSVVGTRDAYYSGLFDGSITERFGFDRNNIMDAISLDAYNSASRPNAVIAEQAGIGACSVLYGRQYRGPTGMGGSVFTLAISSTGTGKDQSSTYINRLLAKIEKSEGGALEVLGASYHGSGIALRKEMCSKNLMAMICFYSECGYSLSAAFYGGRVSEHHNQLRQDLMALATSNRIGGRLGASNYSSKDNNVSGVASPSLTMIAESTAESFFEGLDFNSARNPISDGYLPRFLIMPSGGKRKYHNKKMRESELDRNAFAEILARFRESKNLKDRSEFKYLEITDEAQILLDQIDVEQTDFINNAESETIAGTYTRNHEMIIRLATLRCVTDINTDYVIKRRHVEWAMYRVLQESSAYMRRIIGIGNLDEASDQSCYKKMCEFLMSTLEENDVVKRADLQRRAYSWSCFKHHKAGANRAFKGVLEELIENGVVSEVKLGKGAGYVMLAND